MVRKSVTNFANVRNMSEISDSIVQMFCGNAVIVIRFKINGKMVEIRQQGGPGLVLVSGERFKLTSDELKVPLIVMYFLG